MTTPTRNVIIGGGLAAAKAAEAADWYRDHEVTPRLSTTAVSFDPAVDLTRRRRFP